MSAHECADPSKVELACAAIRSFGELSLCVTGSSMLPAIRPGDRLKIRRCLVEDASAGEVVLFTRHRRLFVHRVVARSSASLVTQGDTTGLPDPAIGADELLGKVVQVERGGKPVRGHPGLTYSDRILAALVRRSVAAGRLLTRLNGLSLRVGA